MDLAGQARALAQDLLSEAERANQRRGIAVHGDRNDCIDLATELLDAVDIPQDDTTVVSERDMIEAERVPIDQASSLLGTTRRVIVIDCHDSCAPNVLGQVVGAVDGGGLLLLLLPKIDDWSARGCRFHESLAVPPNSGAAVDTHYHERLGRMIRAHRGIAVIDATSNVVESDGLTDPSPMLPRNLPEPPTDHWFPFEAYDACLTADQREAVAALEALREAGTAAVIEADRGRGKSAAAGLAAACFAMAGDEVLVTASEPPGTDVLFERARALLSSLDRLQENTPDRMLTATDGGQVRYEPPAAAIEQATDADVLIVDEAAGLPVRQLESCLAADRVAFLTTVHGYEGTGRGFEVRFRDRLGATDRNVIDVHLAEPIRYAAADPLEVWAFRTLALDARPPVDPLVSDATPESTHFRTPSTERLVSDERHLRQVFGLLVEAHYRTEPADLVRILDAPNIDVYTRCHDGRPVSVALLTAEGGLDVDRRNRMYEGERVAGNLLPDLFTSQLRDIEAGALEGFRILRIATHRITRSRNIGSNLLEDIASAVKTEADWLGVGYGATPRLVSFWASSDYRPVHVSTTRNDTSGEYSVLMLRPLSEAGTRLTERLEQWLIDRIPAVLSDACSDVDPDVVRETLRATEGSIEVTLSDREWRVVAGAGYGPGLYDVDPRPFRTLAMAHLSSPADGASLDPRAERLLILKTLQAHSWKATADRLGYESGSACKRAIGRAVAALVDRFGGSVAASERERFRN